MSNLKSVSFEEAKAIKEAGYPQECELWYNKNGIKFSYTEDYSECYARPTYIEVWLWLWREKKITLLNLGNINNEAQIDILINGVFIHTTDVYSDPEEAIIAAIEYLIENDLIK